MVDAAYYHNYYLAHKDKHAKNSMLWAKNNPAKRKAIVLRTKEIIRKEFRALVDSSKDIPCADCGNKFPSVCMDFDHRDGKDKLINVSAMCGFPDDKIILEINKCDVVCANCHRLRTHKRGYDRVN